MWEAVEDPAEVEVAEAEVAEVAEVEEAAEEAVEEAAEVVDPPEDNHLLLQQSHRPLQLHQMEAKGWLAKN
jgi:hypothetical protein